MILIAGATGTNGTEIIKQLAGRGIGVRAMVRRKPQPGKRSGGRRVCHGGFRQSGKRPPGARWRRAGISRHEFN
jgi:uncharacterized protein YbjT (DUF2867 family)